MADQRKSDGLRGFPCEIIHSAEFDSYAVVVGRNPENPPALRVNKQASPRPRINCPSSVVHMVLTPLQGICRRSRSGGVARELDGNQAVIRARRAVKPDFNGDAVSFLHDSR